MSQLYYILSGQHRFAAACELKEKMEKERLPIPDFVTKFNIIKPDTPLSIRQKIAGREHVRQETMRNQSLSDTVAWFLKEVEKVKSSDHPMIVKKDLLKETYIKTGKNPATDGTPVCFQSHMLLMSSTKIYFVFQDNWCKAMNGLAELALQVPDNWGGLLQYLCFNLH